MKNPFEKFTGAASKYRRLHGGDINEVYAIKSTRGHFVLKYNESPLPQMFAKEAQGLTALGDAGLPVPHVIDVTDNAILLEYIEQGEPDHENAGRALAKLHKKTQSSFGLNHDNFIGSLPQPNTREAAWQKFFWEHRIQFQLDLMQRDLPRSEGAVWQRLQAALPQLLDHSVTASLLHGDLWSGNLIWSKKGPVFIDPAIYYGDPLIELSFTKLFGAFSPRFYAAYAEVLPISPKFSELLKLYQIYPLLVHANLFGGNYYQSALQNARHYVA